MAAWQINLGRSLDCDRLGVRRDTFRIIAALVLTGIGENAGFEILRRSDLNMASLRVSAIGLRHNL